jgi:hypothetical protein
MTFAARTLGYISGSSGTPVNAGVTWGVETTTGSCSLTLNTNGTVTYTGNSSGAIVLPPSGSDNWYFPTTTSIGNSYWVKFVNNSNLWTSGGLTNNTIYALSSSRTVGWGTGPILKDVTVYFYNDAAGTSLAGTCQISD